MCLHYQQIAKRVFTRLWDTLSSGERKTLANDVDKTTDMSKWFYAAIATEAKAKFESPNYWMNDPYSFKHAQRDTI